MLEARDASRVEQVLRRGGEGRVQRDDVAALQQLVERHVLALGAGSHIVGQDATAEPAQPVHDRRADPARADDPDGEVAELPAAHLPQPVVALVSPPDDRLPVTHQQEHQHERVVGHAVGRVEDVADRDADRRRELGVDVVGADAPGREVPHAGAAQRGQRGVGDAGLVADADAAAASGELHGEVGERGIRDGEGETEAGGELAEERGFVGVASIDRDADRGRGGLARGVALDRCRSRVWAHTESRRRGVAGAYRGIDTRRIGARPASVSRTPPPSPAGTARPRASRAARARTRTRARGGRPCAARRRSSPSRGSCRRASSAGTCRRR